MKLSAPLYHLKRKARLLSRAENIPLHQALDRVARQEGFGGWSLLAAKMTATAPAAKMFARLAPGDLVLTPSWAWHDHGNLTDERVVWFDGLDLPLIQSLEAMFFELYDIPKETLEKVKVPVAARSSTR